MIKSIFNTEFQQKDITSKIVVGLERISEVFKILLWEYAKTIGISPIQIQILIFLAYHKQELRNVSYLAREFNLTKPTVSDAVKVLEAKGLIIKKHSTVDSRSHTISLSVKGKKIVAKTEDFASPIKNELDKIGDGQLETIYESLNKLIYSLNKAGILRVQRTCYACGFYENKEEKHFCNLLEKELFNKDIRIDCAEFEQNVSG